MQAPEWVTPAIADANGLSRSYGGLVVGRHPELRSAAIRVAISANPRPIGERAT